MNHFDPGKEKYVSLVTFRKTGVEVATPVWIAGYDGAYFIFSESKAGKVKRIRNNANARIAACDIRGKLMNNEWLDATASIEQNPAVIKAMYAAFDDKYGFQMRFLNFLARLSGRINKRTIIKLVLCS